MIPWGHAQEYWEVELPEEDTYYDETLVTSEYDANAHLSLGVNLYEINVDWPLAGQAAFSIPVVAAANSRRNMGYTVTYVGNDYIEIWDPQTLTLGDNDGEWVDIELLWMGQPYDFLYYGHWYEKVFITSNGFVTFDPRAYPDNGVLWTSPNPVSIPTIDDPGSIVAPFWRDLDPSKGGTIRYGNGPFDSFVVMWDNVYNKANSNRQTFAVYFYPEWDGDDEFISFKYESITNDVPTSIGIEDQAGGRGHSFSSVSSGERFDLYPWEDNYHRITEMKVSASKLTVGGANDETAEIYIKGYESMYPGGTNVILQDPADGAFNWAPVISAGTLALGALSMAAGVGWIGVAGWCIDAILLVDQLSTVPRSGDGVGVHEADEYTQTGYVYSLARSEDHPEPFYDRAFDVDLHPLILWQMYDETVTHRLIITAEITVQRPDYSTYTLTTDGIELKITPPPAGPQYVLSIQADIGGTTDPYMGSYPYDVGTQVSVTANPYSWYKFDGWTKDGTYVGTQNPYTITMDADHTLKAWFSPEDTNGGCVAEGTLVTMADGSTKPIEKIKKGDQVLGFWPTNGSYIAENVLDTIKHQVEVIVNINNGMLKLTPLDQPIFIRNSTYEGWMRDPADIQVGWEIYEAQTNGWVPVTSVTFEEGKTHVYDMVLDGYTTYIANGILLMDKC